MRASVTERSTWGGSYSVAQCLRGLMGHFSIVQLPMLPCRGPEAMVMAPPPTRDSAVSLCFHGCLAFLHRYFLPQCPPSHPPDPSLHSQQQPSRWGCSTLPKLQLPAAAPSRGPHPCPGYVWLRQGLSDSLSIEAATDQLFHSQP